MTVAPGATQAVASRPSRRLAITDRPAVIHLVSWSLIGAAVAIVLVNGMGLIGFDSAGYLKRMQDVEALNRERVLPGGELLGFHVVVLVLVALFAASWVVIALAIRGGHPSARIVATLLLGTSAVVPFLQQPTGTVFTIDVFVSAGCLTVVWLLWLPPANRFFRAVGTARRELRAVRWREVRRHPPAWITDPSGRHQHRYWDGTTWTEHVADDGVAALDPI